MVVASERGGREARAALLLLVCGASSCTFPEYDLYRGTTGAAGVTPFSTAGAAAGNGGSASGGSPSAGSSSVVVCEPSATDQHCDGLDEACQPTKLDDGCPKGCSGMVIAGGMYMLCLATATFELAESQCAAHGMRLVKIDDRSENELALGFASALGPYVWVGASNRDDLDVFTWSDGDAFFKLGRPMAGRYENFAEGQPGTDAAERCVQLEERKGGVWSNTSCSDGQDFVCERY